MLSSTSWSLGLWNAVESVVLRYFVNAAFACIEYLGSTLNTLFVFNTPFNNRELNFSRNFLLSFIACLLGCCCIKVLWEFKWLLVAIWWFFCIFIWNFLLAIIIIQYFVIPTKIFIYFLEGFQILFAFLFYLFIVELYQIIIWC